MNDTIKHVNDTILQKVSDITPVFGGNKKILTKKKKKVLRKKNNLTRNKKIFI